MTMTMERPAAQTPRQNGDFPYQQKTFRPDETAKMTQALHDDGFALMTGVLSPDEVETIKAAIDNLKPFGFDKQGLTDHYKCVFNRDQLFLNLLDREGVVDLAEASMGEQCHIIGQTAWRSHPGHNGWNPHTDRIFMELPEDVASDPRVKLPIYLCTAHYYLNDLTLDLAPTWVIPGSHKSGRALHWGREGNPVWQGKELEPVLCKAGDVLFFRSEIWHTGSKNTSEETRYLLQNHYSHRVIAQQFSPYLTWQFSNEVMQTATPRQRRLLGEHKQGAYD